MFSITIHKYDSSCEDCGYYEWGYVEVSRDGNEIMRKGWSGHLGGDIQGPDQDLAEFVREILLAVGVDAVMQENNP